MHSFYTILLATHLLRIGKLSKHSLMASPVCVSVPLLLFSSTAK